ncbi:hypothetical protein TVAG_001860 [Trichomonas vaginalis G3]|uniref:Uncharacterized protein n=1 Tax=Trichomonas vaginalis (strain ATCC PRA-98 / G3) TaxID=412133 RepID=A2FTX1_TRIV3|nr:hypothetical protein TVAGG3_0130260 [Trichomonas vaginalis G3]EAX91634.1 hypothetical protein TVAG_001860 [Trichomonas vaginalis G3]KAI5546046.1 hypothetical protein TVAGG3_0130260 [Trichomonas vaginalis G3]|eukprot:XP_001304564.1 hypothetical protein [Trichomonas vaginalis G3]
MRRQFRFKQIPFKEPQIDPIDEIISQLSDEMQKNQDHPLCKLLEENVKCTQQLAESLEEMSSILSDVSSNINIIPQGKSNYTKAEQIKAELEARLIFHAKCNDPNWPVNRTPNDGSNSQPNT